MNTFSLQFLKSFIVRQAFLTLTLAAVFAPKVAAQGNTEKLVEQKNAVEQKIGNTPVPSVAEIGQMISITELPRSGANLEARTNRGNTPLHVAALNGQVGSITELLGLGANIEAANNQGS